MSIVTREQLLSFPADAPYQLQMQNSFTRHEQIAKVLNNVGEVDEGIYSLFNMRVSPYTAQLMDPNDPNCPIRKQYLPSNGEMPSNVEFADSLGEDEDMIENSSVVHRYPRRVLFLVYQTCGSYCRYCTRKRMVSHTERTIVKDEIETGLDYISNNTEIEDVLLSGGDPLLLSDKRLDYILGEIRRRAPHVRFLRIGSRLPVQIPSRITNELISVLTKHDVDLLNVHVNHPKEITPYFKAQMRKLAKSGILLGNQAVLLKGVNDDPKILRELFFKLIDCRVRPYYVYSCDAATGNGPWYVPYRRMLEIIEQLRGWISGPVMPTFVVDGVGGLGKLPVQPEYVTLTSDGKVMLRNFEGKTARALHLEEIVKQGE